ERADRLERLLDEDRRRGFDLERPPLLRLALIRWSDVTVKVLWSHHHLVLDGWSVQLLLGEVKAHYRAFCRNEVPQLQPPRRYRDFIEWLGQRDRSDDERWWRNTLRGFATPTPLLPARAEPSDEGIGAASHDGLELAFDDELSAQVERFARANRLTLSTIMRGAWAILLSRYSSERDIVFGVTVAGRPADLAGADTIIGLFINTLPVRISVADDEPVAAWMQRLQAQQAELRDREHCSLADIQRWSDVAPGVGLFESLLVVENYPRSPAARGVPVQPGLRRQRPLETASYPLALVVRPGDRIAIKAIYRPSRFDEPTVVRALGHLRTIVHAATRDPQMRIGDLPLLTEAERGHLLVELSDTGTQYPQRSLHALFEEQADRTPGAVAIVFGDEQLTYAELDRRANRLANQLRALGLQREGRVGIFLQRSLGAVVAALAIAKAGGAYVPLDPSYPADRLAFMMQDADVGFVVTNGEAKLERSPPVVRLGDPAWDEPGCGEQRPAVTADADSLAYVIYTSGSTGRPKGVMVEQRAVVRLVLNTNYVTLTPDDRVALASNFAFDAATFELWGALLNGACLVGVPREVALHPPALAAHLREQRISVIFLTTALFNQVADRAPGAFAPVRHVMFGGEPADPRRVRAVLAGGPPALLMNVYGPTETTTFATFFPIEEMPPDAARSVPVGWPVANARVAIVDAATRPVAIGVTGELVIGGDGLARGYVGEPQLTAERFLELPDLGRVYRTGDLARIDQHGCITLLGRRDDQIKIRGYRVEPAELQGALQRHPDIQHAIALADHTHQHTRLIAYIVAHPGQHPNTTTLRNDLQNELPDYLLPTTIITLDELPLT
ncbi:MAG TPA: amino acid adenylation domain-containing protein, partial [Solirubrobacteraceae bacterium]|nr:amino acid adenylation domain-containing protein [Solirubrobacteraceae bacterium]